MIHADIDVAIFGGGIAGLWTLARLRQAGYNAWLFEPHALGGVQSIASQGIIHGGTKYALTGKQEIASQAISAMPGRWRDCLQGSGELDLSSVKVISEYQYLWSTGNIASSLAGFFAGKLMRARVKSLAKMQSPAPFDDPNFKGKLYQLQEPVLDVPSLMQALVAEVGEFCLLFKPDELSIDANTIGFETDSDIIKIKPQALVFSAGAGNAGLLAKASQDKPKMQRRPLHMLMVRGQLPAVFAHALGPSALPRLTVTSYPLTDGTQVWYLGGQVAEQGVSRDTEQQIAAGKQELATLLPWIDQSGLQWATLRIDRAEPESADGTRPNKYFVQSQENIITVWPTKLAFAPRVADKVMVQLRLIGVQPGQTSDQITAFPQPPLAMPPWQEVTSWN